MLILLFIICMVFHSCELMAPLDLYGNKYSHNRPLSIDFQLFAMSNLLMLQ